MRLKKIVPVLFVLFFDPTGITNKLFGQCSDAGFCSVGALRTSQNRDTTYSNLTISQFFGLGEQNTLHFTLYPEVNLKIRHTTELQVRIPYTIITGNLATTQGPGDLSFGFTQTITQKINYAFKLTLGGKVPLVQPNKSAYNKPLPMAYQTTLGTNDLIAGVACFYKKWIFGIGYQHPFNSNSNAFLHSGWNNYKAAGKYFQSNQLKRSDDMLLRAERSYNLPKDKKIFIGLLSIYHIQKDNIINEAGKSISLARSDGLTVNLTMNILFPLKNNFSLRVSSANPVFLSRLIRPDGLTRTFNIGLHLERRFAPRH